MTPLPFDLKLTNLHDANLLIQQQWPTKTISLVNTLDDLIETGDHESIKFVVDNSTLPGISRSVLSLKNISTLLNFAQGISTSDRLLICSTNGISRSTAVAIGVLCLHGLTPSQAFHAVMALVPNFDPNQWILYQLGINSGLKLALLDEYKKWSAHKKHWVNSIPPLYSRELERNAREFFDHYNGI